MLARNHNQFLEKPYLPNFLIALVFVSGTGSHRYHRQASNLELQILLPSPLLGLQAGATTWIVIVFRIEARALFILGKHSASVGTWPSSSLLFNF